MTIWQFAQDQILGMKWLNDWIGHLLQSFGLDLNSRLGGSVQFFFVRCDQNYAFAVLFHFCDFLYPKLLSAGKKQTDFRQIPWHRR